MLIFSGCFVLVRDMDSARLKRSKPGQDKSSPERTAPNGEKNSAQSQCDVKRERLLKLLTTVLPLERGTIWWVDEPLWIRHRANYDRFSTRREHPGLFLRARQDFETLYEPIPMAPGGTSAKPSKRMRLDVKGLLADTPDRVSHFDVRSPAILFLYRFAEWREEASEGMRVRLNRDKPRLSSQEREQLERLLELGENHGK